MLKKQTKLSQDLIDPCALPVSLKIIQQLSLHLFAIECTVYLCDFHREQAWERWVAKKDNGVSSQKEELLSRLRRIARASTEAKYNSAVSDLKHSQIWKTNIKVQKWFGNTWLKASKV